jgi:hypothetical protein
VAEVAKAPEILVPVSVGELVDKVTILRIKEQRITDPGKVRNIRAELAALEAVAARANIALAGPLVADLTRVNERLWEIEDDIRAKERSKVFDPAFVELARAVYLTNDQRFALKSRLNESYGSAYREEKSYEQY